MYTTARVLSFPGVFFSVPDSQQKTTARLHKPFAGNSFWNSGYLAAKVQGFKGGPTG